MAFNLGSIRADLGLDESNYVRGMLNAEAASEIFGQKVVQFINNPLLGSIGLFKQFGAAAVQSIKETAFANQELVRTSDRLGISIRTVSGLQAAYEDMGLEAAEFEKQLTALSMKVDEASHGNQGAIEIFQRLGVTVTDSAGNLRPMDDILRDVSDGLRALGNEQQQIAVGNQLFSESFVKVKTIIGDGAGTIEQFIQVADDMGYVLGEEMATQSDRAASALGELDQSIEGVERRLAGSFLVGFAGQLSDTEIQARNVARVINQELGPAAEKLGEKVAIVAKRLDVLLGAYKLLAQLPGSKIPELVFDFAGRLLDGRDAANESNRLEKQQDAARAARAVQ